jgi:nucleoside-diphosphate-sugar epimerase
VNIASGEAASVRAVAEALAQAAGRPDLLDVGAVPRRADEPEEIVADVSRLRDEVGFRPRRSLRDGLADTVRWWREVAA